VRVSFERIVNVCPSTVIFSGIASSAALNMTPQSPASFSQSCHRISSGVVPRTSARNSTSAFSAWVVSIPRISSLRISSSSTRMAASYSLSKTSVLTLAARLVVPISANGTWLIVLIIGLLYAAVV